MLRIKGSASTAVPECMQSTSIKVVQDSITSHSHTLNDIQHNDANDLVAELLQDRGRCNDRRSSHGMTEQLGGIIIN